MAATGMVALFWMTSKLKRRQFEDSSTQTERLKTDAFTQVEVQHLREKSTLAQEIKCDASTQVEPSHFEAKFTQTVAEIMLDKDVQTFLEISENKETQASPCLCLEKEVQTVILPRSSKVPAHFKKQIKKPTIPLTSNFLKYFDRKFDVQGRSTELATKVDGEHGKEHDLCKLPSHDELEIQAPMLDKDIADQNSSKISVFESGNYDTDDRYFLEEGKVNTANDPVPFKHEYARGYTKLREPREKQNDPSFLKKKFQKLKKLLKI
ncbi:hypothetical protein AVEN_13114-1 [Araneus ventricosus]|uniref:Uncharacterized protein n=1 Tax=Araneus ventricosus TaxID=182803 RepID=A0A4Y2RX85_ARAVE|nr:hypothetical protein AVEN_13114-1 [Araneus ventricosus]